MADKRSRPVDERTPRAGDAATTRARLRLAVPSIAALIAVAVFVAAGNWQRGRMQQKLALGEQRAAASAVSAVTLPAGDVAWNEWRFRVVEAQGRYDAARQMLIDNRVHDARAGYHVVTPLRTADGRVVLVNRGWVGASSSRALLPSAPPESGEVRVRGRINPSPGQYLELGSTVPERGVWQNLDPARFSAHTGIAVLPVVLEQVDGPADGLVRDWPHPDDGADRHRIYMVQWYAFAALAAGLWAWFTFRRKVSR